MYALLCSLKTNTNPTNPRSWNTLLASVLYKNVLIADIAKNKNNQ